MFLLTKETKKDNIGTNDLHKVKVWKGVNMDTGSSSGSKPRGTISCGYRFIYQLSYLVIGI